MNKDHWKDEDPHPDDCQCPLCKHPTMDLLGFKVVAPKFQYEDKVWAYFDPMGLEDHCELPIFQCEIEGARIAAVSEYQAEPEVKIEYKVSILDSIDMPRYKKEGELFATEAEAAQYALSMLDKKAESWEKKAARLTSMVRQMKGDLAKSHPQNQQVKP